MQIWYKDVSGYLQLEVLDADGKVKSGLTVTYSVRLTSSGVEQDSGTLVYANGVYSKAVTLSTAGEYNVVYTTPAGYEDGVDLISVKDYADYKADVSAVATSVALASLQSDVTSIASDVDTIKEIETGKWKIISNQMIVLKSDNTTEICRFNLYDSDGNPTMTAVAERRKV